MADFTLKSGREIVFDFDAISLKEFRILQRQDPPPTKEESDPLFARVCGLTVDELENEVKTREFFRLRKKFWQAAFIDTNESN